MACMCGATDCPSCGPAQGYRVVYRPGVGWRNPLTKDECPECGETVDFKENDQGQQVCGDCGYTWEDEE